MCLIPERARLFLDSAHGIHIPRLFFEQVNRDNLKWNCTKETREWILDQTSDPNNKFYWDAWNEVDCMDLLTVTDPVTKVDHYLIHDGDLWLVPCLTEGAQTNGTC